jgi:5'-3' exonuclease
MQRVHLVDGTYELFRMFYGAPKVTGPDGREVGATRALLRSMLALLYDPEVTHVGVAFDHVIESFRNDLFDGYKTGVGVDPALMAQFELAEAAMKALGVVAWPMVEFEADDAIASAAKTYASEVDQVVICSPDKDFAQCVDGRRVVLHDRRQRIVYDEDGVRQKFGVGPSSIPDYLALVGDTADGIPGIPKWGPKAAATLLGVYVHLEHIPDDAAAWTVSVRGAEALAQSLREARGEATLFKTLATLRTDAPLEVRFDELAWRGADRATLGALCDTIGDDSFVERVTRFR